MAGTVKILIGDVRNQLRSVAGGSVRCCITSPPYWGLRDYRIAGQLGLEATPRAYVEALVAVFRELWRVLADDGTLWLNLGDSYSNCGKWGGYSGGKNAHSTNGGEGYRSRRGKNAKSTPGAEFDGPNRKAIPGLKPKDLCMIPAHVAIGLQADGWFLRSQIIWAKPNGMPGSQDDRPTSSYESIFLLAKGQKYFSDFDSIRTPPRESTMIRNAQNVQAQAGSHRANGGSRAERPMKSVIRQRGAKRPRAGFASHWDQISRREQQATPATIRDVWFIAPARSAEEHFAVMPEEVARRCILAGSEEGDTVIDPFFGSGTVGVVASALDRHCVGIELNPEFAALAKRRLRRGYDPAPRPIVLSGQKKLFDEVL